ncbi:MAG: ORF6N domain-containing protein [Deltaproteobacteria bacterium]|nr:ORF6N domain-containing protein [Deltaproteobacteria bacterium]
MFYLTKEELDDLRCQFGTSSWGGARYNPMVFTEQGVAMLYAAVLPGIS